MIGGKHMTDEIKKVAVVGIGYVGCSMACLLAKNVSVTAFDTDESKIKLLNAGLSPINDPEIIKALSSKLTNLTAKNITDATWTEFDTAILCVPTDFDATLQEFDTKLNEQLITSILDENKDINIVIKSTLNIGFCERIRSEKNFLNLYFSPEFLREGYALYDN